MIIEIVVYNFESAWNAQLGGADRIELCDNPGEGGTTPSIGMIELIRNKINLDLFVMIRPRGGDFLYSDEEFEIMKRDIMAAKRVGADGIVFGILTKSGRIDTDRCKELIQLAKPMSTTCHRAFDMTRDMSLTLEECISCGFDRILTSGGKAKAIDGVERLKSIIEQSKGRIEIMPGSGINALNISELMSSIQFNQVHLSAMMTKPSEMEFKNTDLGGIGSSDGMEYSRRTVDFEVIKKIKQLTIQQ